ncbi:MAG TPA: hypothetical protein VIV60_02570, partial [Polyangiaceae bacterium]
MRTTLLAPRLSAMQAADAVGNWRVLFCVGSYLLSARRSTGRSGSTRPLGDKREPMKFDAVTAVGKQLARSAKAGVLPGKSQVTHASATKHRIETRGPYDQAQPHPNREQPGRNQRTRMSPQFP